MISPYVRRLRLARELEALLERAGVSQTELARMIGENRRKISELMNAKVRPRQDDIMRILEALGVSGDEWSTIMRIAEEAASRGWWESSARRMGPRQARTADLEAGAATIQEYAATYPPGLLQTPEYTRAIHEYDDLTRGSTNSNIDAMVEARASRQRMVRRPGGPTYEAIIDEVAIRRPTAPLDIFAAQLRCLAEDGSVRVLPIGAHIESWTVPRTPWSRYTYPDEGDPVVVSVDTATEDMILTDPEEVHRYEMLYARLCNAALSVQDSAELLLQAAEEMEKNHGPV